MHPLFSLVLGQKDLSRAGDLFSLDDVEIEAGLSEALEKIQHISSSSDYQNNDNDQAVVEICITRITTAIRETDSIEKHGEALVALWESCLEHNLKPAGKDEDTPHAKIASDIMSCILQNYNRPPIMALAVPVAVKFLQRGNKELCRNMSSYLSLAAIANADLLADHTEAVISSVLQGNSMLLRVLPSVYEKRPQPINEHLTHLMAQMSGLEQAEQHHLLRLLQTVAQTKQPGVLIESVPFLISQLRDPNHNDMILNILVEMSSYEPLVLATYLPTLKEIGDVFPSLIGQMAKIYGAVGRADEETARICLRHLVNLLANIEHSFHHILLLEIKKITDTYGRIVGPQSREIYRMSNSFTAVAMLMSQQLQNECATNCRTENGTAVEPTSHIDETKLTFNGTTEEEKLQDKIQGFEEKMTAEGNTPGPVRRYSTSQASKEHRKDLRFSRTRSLAFQAIPTKDFPPDATEDLDNGGLMTDISLSELFDNQQNDTLTSLRVETAESKPPEGEVGRVEAACTESSLLPEKATQNLHESSTETPKDPCEPCDSLYLHLKENLNKMKAYVKEIGKKIPVPDKCVIEDTLKGFVAKLFFSCPRKGHYCLYSKSSFTLISRQPHLWVHIMFLFQQSLLPGPMSVHSNSFQVLKALWEKAQLKGTHSFETTMIQSTFPHKKDLDQVQMHLEEVRFFDLFSFTEEAGAWQCFMCNNPEKATVVHQEGQPLIEGKLKEKQIRWKFIKRWKTRYFTLEGNQLLFRKGKYDDPDDCPIELTKVQSVKVVTKKRRDRSLPRAFEIFTDSKTYVFKAKDEKNAEEWLQCINVAVVQAKDRESRESTTYL
ncbi:ventricular zone-expressed PH domain-containing protein homolog 1 isoform X2 [Ambystoma mexicanum]|uniref:ventricular zone-expressed PH domain-containing protein homolog 1 isoform X2 n=1 Tax=Ambystoma mexicanum TaxID=8296 RepID=UPI0037E762FD